MGVSDFLMMSLAKLTVAVGREVKNAVADTEVYIHTHTCMVPTATVYTCVSAVCEVDGG